ncbi:MAG: metallophosphoesterase family protein, partial [Cyclobacteriaceae bacterium]|nr:metallophosphoesterase family protein [Cyclobacteriaceae bacterium]
MKVFTQLFIVTLITSLISNTILAQTTLINYGASYSYYDNANEPALEGALDWNDVAYNASAWETGNAHLGYGDSDEATTINENTNAAYVRHTFTFDNASPNTSLNLNLTYDDGAVVYLNGNEVWRVNMPIGAISYNTFAITSSGENATASTIISDLLIVGTNVLAVEIHQENATSSDISFDFQLIGTTPEQVIVIRGPYLQKGTSSSMVVRWRTATATESVIDYGTALGNLDQNVSDLTIKTEHEIEITGLAANTLYYYQIGNSSAVLIPEASELYFITHPTTGSSQPLTFWVLGDAGTANNNQRAVRDAYYNYIGTDFINGILFLGDNAYNDGSDTEYQSAIFDIYDERLKNSVAWSTMGNHDGNQADSESQTGPYYDIFTFPKSGESGGMASGTEAYYSFDYGNVHFIVLESCETDRSIGGAMYNWAVSDIQNTIQDWIIAFWHHPPYSKGSHDSDTETPLEQMRQNFLPMLENNGVDLVLSGHSHSYERSYFLNGHYGTSGTFNSATHTIGINGYGDGKIDGTGAYEKTTNGADSGKGAVYVVAGSSGTLSNVSNHDAMAVALYQFGSCIIEVDGNVLNVKFIRETGAIDDYFTIQKDCLTAGCDEGPSLSIDDVSVGEGDGTLMFTVS